MCWLEVAHFCFQASPVGFLFEELDQSVQLSVQSNKLLLTARVKLSCYLFCCVVLLISTSAWCSLLGCKVNLVFCSFFLTKKGLICNPMCVFNISWIMRLRERNERGEYFILVILHIWNKRFPYWGMHMKWNFSSGNWDYSPK